MMPMSRLNFIVVANAIWLAQFAGEFLMLQAPDAVAWRERMAANLQIGCVGDTYYDAPLEQLYIFGLLWVLSAPLMSVIAWKFPHEWPSRLARPWWNRVTPALSAVTLLLALALLAWPLKGALAMPVTSVIVTEAARAVTLLMVALYYRAIVLSA